MSAINRSAENKEINATYADVCKILLNFLINAYVKPKLVEFLSHASK